MKNSSWWRAVVLLLIGLAMSSLLGYRLGASATNAEKSRGEASFLPAFPTPSDSGPGYVYFSGRIKQGALPLPADRTLTLSQVVIMDGGVDDFADQQRIHIQRPQPDNSFATIPVDLKAILIAGHTERDPVVHAGDIVVVPEKLINY